MATPINSSTMTGVGSSLSVNGKTFGVGLQTSQLKSIGSGLPAGVTVSGQSITVHKAGVRLEGYDLRGYSVSVEANNVTIKNNLFNAASWHTVFQGASSSGLVVEYNTFDGQKANNSNADLVFSESGAVTIRNNEFINLPTDAVNVAGGTIEHNYFGGSGYQTGAHADAISIHRTAAPVMIRENYIDFIDRPDAQTGTNAAIKIVSHFGAIDHVTVDSNVLLGGGYSIYTGDAGNPVSNVTFSNNDIGLSNWGDLFPGSHGSNFAWQNNHSFSSGALSASGSSSPVKSVVPAKAVGSPAGTTKAHYIPGSELQDILFGTAGKDAIVLKGGFDICLAGAGDDAVYGGFGPDWIAGQAGNDRYVYKSVLDSLPIAMQRDVIVDWSPGHDRIDLRSIDADTKLSGNQAFSWIDSKSFSGSAGEVRSYFDGRSTIVEADVNGDKHADMQIELWGKHVMKISDFLL